MNRRTISWISVLVVIAAGALTWWSWSRPRSNVLLITIDTLRPDHLSAYGYDQHRTPNFDRLAQEGVLFENAFCDVTWTIPSMASVMTGQYATRHGVRSVFQRLSPATTTIAEVLRATGMKTAAIVGSYPLDSIFGLDHGFDLYDDRFTRPLVHTAAAADGREAEDGIPDDSTGRPLTPAQLQQFLHDKTTRDGYRPDDEVSDRAIQWLTNERSEPFFLWVHYFGPHEKLFGPNEAPHPIDDWTERGEMIFRRYDPDVLVADEQVGRVLAALDDLGLKQRTIVIVHADHGQSLNEHDYFGHGRRIYDPTQRIPLIIRFPSRLPAATRVDRMARNIDLFPTIAELLEIPLPVETDGASLLPVMRGEESSASEEVYVETYASAIALLGEVVDPVHNRRVAFRRLGIRTPEWKFVINDPVEFMDIEDPPEVNREQHEQYYSEELYDLRDDPGEERNLIAQRPEIATALRAKVIEYQRGRGEPGAAIELDEESRARLRSLGYPVH